MIRLAHDEEREVLPYGLSKALDEVFRRDLQLESRPALAVGLLLEPIPGNSGEGSGLAVGEAQGHREIRVAIIVQGEDVLAALREDPRERTCHGGLAGAAFSADRDLHRADSGSVPYWWAGCQALSPFITFGGVLPASLNTY